MGNYKEKASNCIICKASFESVKCHSKDMCVSCYYKDWYANRHNRLVEIKSDSESCIECGIVFGTKNKKGRLCTKKSRNLCQLCYGRSYSASRRTKCSRCDNETGKRGVGLCSLCKVEIETMKPSKTSQIPKFDKINIDKDTKESLRRVLNRYKFGLNTLADPFIVTDIYLSLFTNENLKLQKKVEFNLDQFDQEAQVIAMLKLLKIAYDKSI